MNETIKLLKSHASIRKFQDKPVSDEIVETLVGAGTAASTSSNLQATTVIQVRDEANRIAIANLAGDQSYVAKCGAFLVWCADLHRSRTACELSDGEFCAGMTEHLIIATVDVSLAAQNAAIAAESLGLGICYIGGIRNDPSKVARLLQLPEQVFPVFGMCIGWPAHNPPAKPRLPVSVTLMQDRYHLESDGKWLEDYDQTMADYYQERGVKNRSWSSSMAKLLSRESRPHMKEFLMGRGFGMR